MKSFYKLGAKGRRQLARWISQIRKHHGCTFVRGEGSFRIIERLHRAGLLAACITKANWFGKGRRPFRELVVYEHEKDV